MWDYQASVYIEFAMRFATVSWGRLSKRVGRRVNVGGASASRSVAAADGVTEFRVEDSPARADS